MQDVVVVTGGSAGVGRATAEEFARRGYKVAILARGQERLDAAAEALRRFGVPVRAVPTDMADPDAVEAAADRVEHELGPIGVWVNNAMATAFAPVMQLTPADFRRGTEATYLAAVHGTMAALRRMQPRGRGTIVQVGSALSYRAVPLQAIYCASKFAIRGFTDSLRSELIHDGSPIHLTMVHLPAVNTPQFDWALNRTGHRARPVPPVFQPEVPARAIVFAATHRRREVWVGFPTVKAIWGNKLAPGLLDHYLAKAGYSGQLTQEPEDPDRPANLYEPVPGRQGSHGRFDSEARTGSLEMWTSRHRNALALASLALGCIGVRALFSRRRTITG